MLWILVFVLFLQQMHSLQVHFIDSGQKQRYRAEYLDSRIPAEDFPLLVLQASGIERTPLGLRPLSDRNVENQLISIVRNPLQLVKAHWNIFVFNAPQTTDLHLDSQCERIFTCNVTDLVGPEKEVDLGKLLILDQRHFWVPILDELYTVGNILGSHMYLDSIFLFATDEPFNERSRIPRGMPTTKLGHWYYSGNSHIINRFRKMSSFPLFDAIRRLGLSPDEVDLLENDPKGKALLEKSLEILCMFYYLDKNSLDFLKRIDSGTPKYDITTIDITLPVEDAALSNEICGLFMDKILPKLISSLTKFYGPSSFGSLFLVSGRPSHVSLAGQTFTYASATHANKTVLKMYATEDECIADTKGYSSNGKCKEIPYQEGKKMTACWKFVCNPGYEGLYCQVRDVSFLLSIFLCIVFIITSIVGFCAYKLFGIKVDKAALYDGTKESKSS